MIGLFAVLLALALATAWMLAALMSLGWAAVLRRQPAERALRWGRWSLVPVAGALGAGALVAVAASGLFDHGLHCHCLASGGYHLCLVHPAQSTPLVPVAVGVLALLALRIGPALWRWAAARRSSRRLVDAARRVAPERGVHVVDLPVRNAFTVGRRPVVVAGRAWWTALGPDQRALVMAHEQAHVARRDPVTLSVASFLAAWLPPVSERLVWWWHAAAEHAADRQAARVSTPIAVAEFLLSQASCGSRLIAAHGTATEQRIVALLDSRAPVGPVEGDLDVTLAAVVALFLGGALFGAELHAWAESLLAWLS